MGLFSKKNNIESQQTEVIPQATAVTDDELIAIISAAIAAFEGGGATSNLVIRKINRTAGVLPAWGVAGNRDTIAGRF